MRKVSDKPKLRDILQNSWSHTPWTVRIMTMKPEKLHSTQMRHRPEMWQLIRYGILDEIQDRKEGISRETAKSNKAHILLINVLTLVSMNNVRCQTWGTLGMEYTRTSTLSR
jgi:hypothetical protein